MLRLAAMFAAVGAMVLAAVATVFPAIMPVVPPVLAAILPIFATVGAMVLAVLTAVTAVVLTVLAPVLTMVAAVNEALFGGMETRDPRVSRGGLLGESGGSAQKRQHRRCHHDTLHYAYSGFGPGRAGPVTSFGYGYRTCGMNPA